MADNEPVLSEPTQPTTGGVVDTTEGDLVPPGMTTHQRIADDAIEQVTRLSGFLVKYFPEEIDLSNRQVPETPVDTATRLLLGFISKIPPGQLERCPAEYCNKPKDHQDVHGWVQAD